MLVSAFFGSFSTGNTLNKTKGSTVQIIFKNKSLLILSRLKEDTKR